MSEATVQQYADAATLTPHQWHHTLTAPPLLSSETTAWPSALLRQWSGTSAIMEQPVLDHHYVTLHVGGPKRVNRRGEGSPVSTNVEPDGLSIMPAGSTFTWQTEGPIGFVHLYLSPRMVAQVVMEDFDRESRTVSLIDRVGFSDSVLSRLLWSMLGEVRAPGTASRLLLDSLLRAFTLKVLRDHSTLEGAAVHAGYELAPYRLRRVVAFIEAHLVEDIRLADLAALAGMSLYHFCRGFHLATGLPPYRYVVERRIQRAKVLLIEDSLLSLSDVARQCGFNSQRQFGTMFAKLVGISPGRFRRER